jgi:hypothetical protein
MHPDAHLATHTKPSDDQWQDLARHVHPLDAKLAAQLAQMGKSSLLQLGLEKPVPPPPMAPAPAPLLVPPQPPPAIVVTAPPPPPRPLPPEVVESVVCAAAEAMNVMPAVVRPVLLAAFERAEKIGLTVGEVVRALATTVGSTPRAPKATPG